MIVTSAVLPTGGDMSETAESILAAAMSLPEPEREALTIRLVEMLPGHGGDEELSDTEFAAELLRRKTEMEQGLGEGILWSVLKGMD
jgi:hypothetical protein